MIRSKRVCSTGENVLKEGKRFLMSTEAIEVDGPDPLRRQRARSVWSGMQLEMRHEIRPDLHCFRVTAEALQSLCHFDFCLQRHCGFGTTMTNRPVESVLRGLKR